ncbi:ABC transporter substrate-binding protein [Marinithermofilum abyssi]|uniref:ABC transporter substrate-binding protein n=1 Tax=Marinithermofilum abyssi TaxID=1571185 RepID=UPI001667113F|nr:ABC transporter substrate-binding protein [Marinithermofilum abyssi]
MVKWQRLLSFALIGTLILPLAACGSSGAGKEAESDDQVKIVYARGKDVTGATQKIIKAFEKKHPNIDVEYREMPADTGTSHDQYVTMLSAKSSEIDVFDLDVIWPAEFAQAGYLVPLDRFIQKDGLDLEKYNDAAIEAGKYNGKQWTMPAYIDNGLLFYRKDIVKNPPKTWDELIQQAKRDQGEKGTKYGYLMQAKQYEGLVCNFIEFVESYGGKVLDKNGKVAINSPDSVQGLKKMMELAQSDVVPGNITSFTELESHTSFIEGESPFIRNWPYQYALAQDKKQSKIVGKVGVTQLPEGDEKSAATLGGWATGINKFSKHKKEAWEFMKFLNGPEGQKIAAVHGGRAPTYMPLYDDAEVKKASPLFADKAYIEGVKNAVPRPISPQYPEISDIIQIEVSKALAGKQSAEEAVKNMDQKLKKVLK